MIDCAGSRLVATSYLPVNDSTLIYGMDHEGVLRWLSARVLAYPCIHQQTTTTVQTRNSDKDFDAMMQACANVLCLKPHRVAHRKYIERRPSDMEDDEFVESIKLLCGPQDLEGYRVNDQYYLLDFARVYPPESPEFAATHDFLTKNGTTGRSRGDYLAYHLRGELIQHSQILVSSDAYSK